MIKEISMVFVDKGVKHTFTSFYTTSEPIDTNMSDKKIILNEIGEKIERFEKFIKERVIGGKI